ncbi:MAG: type IVB secretion system protein IcmQ, partial [Rickettsiella sp.]|nr:type IVB secretion system protein IcmQ [Rickettsiella sp.]
MMLSQYEIKVALEIKEILDSGIKEGPWQANLFLKGIKKKLEELRDKFEIEIGLDKLKAEEIKASLIENTDNNVTDVYISLYQS